MAQQAIAISEPFSPTTATVSQPTGSATGGVTIYGAPGGVTSLSSGPGGGATATIGGSTTETQTCRCCSSCSCGPFPTDGIYWNKWFGYPLVGDKDGDCPGAGDTQVGEDILLELSFNIPAIWYCKYPMVFKN